MRGRGRLVAGIEQRAEQAGSELGVEDGDADALGRELVAVGALDASDEPVETEPSQVIAHLAAAVVGAEESGHTPAKAVVGEAGDGVDHSTQGAGQGCGARVPEAKRSGSLALSDVGLERRSNRSSPMAQSWPAR